MSEQILELPLSPSRLLQAVLFLRCTVVNAPLTVNVVLIITQTASRPILPFFPAHKSSSCRLHYIRLHRQPIARRLNMLVSRSLRFVYVRSSQQELCERSRFRGHRLPL